MPSFSFQKLGTLIGTLLIAVSIFFISQQLYNYWQQLYLKLQDARLISIILFLSIIYALSNFFLCSAWKNTIYIFSNKKIQNNINNHIYSKSIIAKYIPGNTMQFVSRHVLMNRLGIKHKQLISSSFAEITSLLTASLILIIFGHLNKIIETLNDKKIILLIILTTFLLASKKIKSIIKKITHEINTKINYILVQVTSKHICFFIISCFIFFMVYQTVNPASELKFNQLLGIYSLSWITGFITPGAPSGLGVREATITLLISNISNDSDGLIVSLAFRIITILGDFIFFAITSLAIKLIPSA